VHHITIERNTFKNFNNTVQNVGINTKCPAWNWVVRYNTISATGTGMYFGGSSGQYEFANSLIEHNLIYNTLGYNAEFKHQLSRNTSIGVPTTATTIIRHNVWVKDTGSLSGVEARPNLLLSESLRGALPGRGQHRLPRQPAGEPHGPRGGAHPEAQQRAEADRDLQ
jgi:hypothetical protein